MIRKPMKDADYAEAIEDGMIAMLWGEAWGNHVEQHKCAKLGGKRLEDVMPPPPEEALDAAKDLIKAYEAANDGTTISTLYKRALAADEADEEVDPDDSEPDAFGGDLVFMALGEEMSWFDEHAEFPLVVPKFDNTALRKLAESQCESAVETQPEG
jgi:hypothetical protein